MLKIVALLTTSILLSMAIVSAIETGHFAEAKMAVGKHPQHRFSYWVGNQVCGDQLCQGTTYYKWNQKYRTFKSPYSAYEHQELSKINSAK